MKKLFLIAFLACYALAYEDIDNSNVSVEVGIGYLNSTFTGKQSGFYNHSSKGSARGVDIYAAVNVYASERFGLQLGMGAEFLNGGWNDECGGSGGNGIGAYNYTMEVLKYSISKDTNSQLYKEQAATLKERFGDEWQTNTLYKDTDKATWNKYKITYTKVTDNTKKGDYAKDDTSATGYRPAKADDTETYTREIQYYFKKAEADTKGNYKQNADCKENCIQGADGIYEYVEGQGDYVLETETGDVYKYSINNTGLYCGTPKLNVKTWYMFLGAFYDVLQFEHFALRAFGNVGIGYDMMKDKFSRATDFYDGGSYEMFYTYNSNQTPSQEQGSVYVPLTAGLRFIIAKNHGIEFVGKYNLIKSKWKGTQTLYNGDYNGKDMPPAVSIDTKITRDYSWGIRYVYEFRND